MKKIIIAVACGVALASCANEPKSNAVTTTPNASATQTPAANPAPQAQPQVQGEVPQGQVQQPQQGNIQIQGNNAAPADGGQAPVSGTINPPHGQPGHTCAVPPGQPIP